jgi:sulfur carrier protein ThiS
MVSLSSEDRERIKDQFDIYDLLEELDVSVDEFIDAFDFKIVENAEIMARISEEVYDEDEE